MTEDTIDPSTHSPTSVRVDVHLHDTPVTVARLGDWTADRSKQADIEPFVSVRVTPDLTVLCGEPDRLDQLAFCLAEEADALRTILRCQQTEPDPLSDREPLV